MKRSIKSVLGVTLLEIMLVLAIAAMIIVMSIRYYQSASLNEKINSTLDMVTSVVATGETYLNATGSFTGFGDTASLPYFPNGKLPSSAWGGPITIAPDTTSYTITIPNLPAADACTQIAAYLTQNSHISVKTDTCVITVYAGSASASPS